MSWYFQSPFAEHSVDLSQALSSRPLSRVGESLQISTRMVVTRAKHLSYYDRYVMLEGIQIKSKPARESTMLRRKLKAIAKGSHPTPRAFQRNVQRFK